jgi:hypothetical protein
MSRHRWWRHPETDVLYHDVNFGYVWSFQLNDRGNLVRVTQDRQLISPIAAGFSIFGRTNSRPGTESEYEEINQAIRERVRLEGWSQQGALLPGQEALRGSEMRDLATHVDNQCPEPQQPQVLGWFHDLNLKAVESYFLASGDVDVRRLSRHLTRADNVLEELSNFRVLLDAELTTFVRFYAYLVKVRDQIARLRIVLMDSNTDFPQTCKDSIQSTKTALAGLRDLRLNGFISKIPASEKIYATSQTNGSISDEIYVRSFLASREVNTGKIPPTTLPVK